MHIRIYDIYIYIYLWPAPPQHKKNTTCLTLLTALAPLSQAYACKTQHTAADMTLRETTKTTNKPKKTKHRKHTTNKTNMIFVVFVVFVAFKNNGNNENNEPHGFRCF